jgi:hypothetical protein
MKITASFLSVLSLMSVAAPTFCAETSLEELERRCQEAREEKLAPLREKAIEECVSSRRTSRTREDCERLYEDFGERGGTVEGGSRPPMFIDLPECVEYFEARDRQGRGGSRR